MWICSKSSCSKIPCASVIGDVKANVNKWAPLGQVIDHCMAEKVEKHCKLPFSFHIAALVIVLNFAKAVIMCLAVFGVRETPLMTLGDAISSFLQRPDVYTEGMCMVSKQELMAGPQNWAARPRTFSSFRQR
jgi:hypothetical protein